MTKQTKKEVKKTITKELITKIIERLELSVAPLTALLLAWDLDVGVYVAAGISMIISILAFVRLFIKEK